MNEYRIVFQSKNLEGTYINEEIISSGKIEKPKGIINLGLRHKNQIEILQKIQDTLLNK